MKNRTKRGQTWFPGSILLVAIIASSGILPSRLPALGQSQTVTPAPAPIQEPSVVDGGSFLSLEGRFSLSLPQRNHGLRGLSVLTPFGPAKGDAYNWTMKEGDFVVGYVDADQALDDPQTVPRALSNLRSEVDRLVKASDGRIVSERQLELDKHPGIEYRIEFFTGVMVHRTYLASRRLYQTMLVVKNNNLIYEPIALKVLDTFKILNESEVAKALAQKVADAEPSPLPQQPVAPRRSTDAIDDGLRGHVKTVLTESESLTGKWSRQRNSLAYYNEQGNLTKRESYDYRGNLSDVTVYGYLDGSRVSMSRRVRHEYGPPTVTISSSATGTERKKFDPRYNYRFDFKYDDKKRLTEKTWFHSNGELWLRYVYNYEGNQREELIYSTDGSLNQHYVSILDNKGNEIEETSYVRSGASTSKRKYVYEFDSQGNWRKRTISKLVSNGDKSEYVPDSVYYREITYYK